MKLIKPSWEIIEQKPGLDNMLIHITKAGYTCYKTNKEITPEVARNFIATLIKRGHTSVLEQGTVYLYMGYLNTAWEKYLSNPYSRVEYETVGTEKRVYVTTNYRVLYENGWLDDLEYLCNPTDLHQKRITVKFITSIGIVRELIRHRVFSFCNESTRYCNYSADRFGNEFTFIIPSWMYKYNLIDDAPIEVTLFDKTCASAESSYKEMLALGLKPEQAREVLPLCTKSELIMTGYVEDWKKFFSLRADETTGKVHPDMLELAVPLKQEFINRGYIK